MPLRRRAISLACALLLIAGCAPPRQEDTNAPAADPAKADAVMAIVRDTMAEKHVKAVIVRVTVDGKEVLTRAVGDSMTGVPATTNMHFRNGAVAISYVSTLLMILVDEKKVSLDDKLSTWLPDVPNADRVTLGQLGQMTSGYVDYVIGNTEFEKALYKDTFRQWEPDQLLGFATSKPLLYEPGTNWNYAHTNYVLLGRALEKATGEDMPKLLEDKVLRPLGLTNTANSFTPEIPEPVCTPSPARDARHSRYLVAHRSTKSRRTGTRRGRSPTAPSRRRTSTTWKPARPRWAPASCCRRSPTRNSPPPIYAARPAPSPAARPAWR